MCWKGTIRFSSADSCGHVAKGNHRICSRSVGKYQWYRLKPHNSRMLLAAYSLVSVYICGIYSQHSQSGVSLFNHRTGWRPSTKASVASILWPRLINISSCLNASTILRYPKPSMNCWHGLALACKNGFLLISPAPVARASHFSTKKVIK